MNTCLKQEIYPAGIINKPSDIEHDSASNGDIMIMNIDNQCIATTVDGFHSATTKPFAY